ncbi:hypothetical protein [Azospirillum halopraeferens]|uniref:hypothetical protein n=1 Tax=Azospirillum halopraeferens TaxID=34010 RepID=UPI000403333D|nr:hypothetical protein [Azospirillum halopraeferens]
MKECRCLVFTEQEVARAVLDRRRKRREELPTGTVQGVTYDATDGVRTTIAVIDDYGVGTPMVLGEGEVAAALVAYCMDRRIPLPVDGDKTLHLIGGALSLMITINFNKPPRLVEGHPAPRRAAAGRRMPLPAA